MQFLTVGSSTKAEFIAVNTFVKFSPYLHMVFKQLGYEQNNTINIYIDNMSTLKIINFNKSSSEQTYYRDI